MHMEKENTRIWFKVRNTRYDCLQKLTTTIAKNHGIVIAEDLRVRNMTSLARGM
ncbi:hypothetical protein [Palaeococcus sp. (in: euryarchaeotes)]